MDYDDWRSVMDERALQEILTVNYGIESPSLKFLREAGGENDLIVLMEFIEGEEPELENMTDCFNLKKEDIALTKKVWQKFLSGYTGYHALSREEILSFPYWVAIRYFQLQATIPEIYGNECIDEGFIDG